MILNGKDCCLIGVVIPVNWDSCRWVNGTQIEILYLAFMMFQYWWCFVFPQTASPATGSAKQNYSCAFILVLSNTAQSYNHSLWAGNTRGLLWSLANLNLDLFAFHQEFGKITLNLAWPRRSFLINHQTSWRCHKDIWKRLVTTSTAEQHVLIRKVCALAYENKYFTTKSLPNIHPFFNTKKEKYIPCHGTLLRFNFSPTLTHTAIP